MTNGAVNAALEAVVPVEVRGVESRAIHIDAIIDTGFNGYLTLPPREIERLALPLVGHVDALLGEGTEVRLSMFEAHLLWDGADRPIHVLEAESGPLLGTALLRNRTLTITFVLGGRVTVTRAID